MTVWAPDRVHFMLALGIETRQQMGRAQRHPDRAFPVPDALKYRLRRVIYCRSPYSVKSDAVAGQSHQNHRAGFVASRDAAAAQRGSVRLSF